MNKYNPYKKQKKIQFDYFWNWKHWYLLPAISLDNYEKQFDIHFIWLCQEHP